MEPPRTPLDEDRRLRTLRSLALLDTLPEERFDRITRIARRMFGVPIALVSLVDADRQWFKSRQGLDATETSREISFCGHAILDDQMLVVCNALDDARFADNPLVTAPPDIRFYAGQPVAAPNGMRVGTLCLIDTEPRVFDAEDQQALRDLSALVEDELAAVHTATVDRLTGLSNRRGFEMIGGRALEVCRRMDRSVSVLFLDMDGLKQINDTYGHEAGDKALCRFADLLSDSFREADVVARLGGDEFVVLLSGAGPGQARRALCRLELAATARGLQFSVGTASFDEHEHAGLGALLDHADDEMYRQKRSKKDGGEPLEAEREVQARMGNRPAVEGGDAPVQVQTEVVG